MSVEDKNLAHAHVETAGELEALQDWWQKHGNRVSTVLCVVLGAILAYNLYERHLRTQAAKASMAYSEATSADAMEGVLTTYKNSAVAPLALLRLGSDHYQRQQLDLAKASYESFLRDYPQHEFAPIAVLGLAHVAEAQGQLADAATRFSNFTTQHQDHYLAPLATLGQARCLALQDRKDEARAILDRMMADRAGTPWAGFADDLLAALPRLRAVKAEATFLDAMKALDLQAPAAATNAAVEAPAAPVAPVAPAAPAP